MNQGTKRTLIIGFFILIWLGIIFYGYSEIKTLNNDNEELSLESSLLKNKLADNNKNTFFTEDSSNIFLEEITKEENIIRESEEIFTEEDSIPNYISDDRDIEKVAIHLDKEKQEEPQKIEIEREMCGDFPCFSDADFVNIYDSFENESGLIVLDKYIYNNKEADNRIRDIAEGRGYKKRVFANESSLVWFRDRRIQPELRDNYLKIEQELKKQNTSLHFVSGYRNSTHQRNIFKDKMRNIDISKISSGFYDKKINSILEVSSIPGYSRHHSGYTVDFGCGNDYLVYSFATTPCYGWLSENNFENAKQFGFIPSYPDDVDKQGPNPEPWEYVWVGRDYIENYFINLDKEKNENL